MAARERPPNLSVLPLSQYVEAPYARELLTTGSQGAGCVLKERVTDGAEFVATVARVAAGGTAMDPEVVSQPVTGRDREEPMSSLTGREREVLECLAQGRSDEGKGIAEALFMSGKAVAKRIGHIFPKPGLPQSDTDHRRGPAVPAYLDR
ncbi:Transcriptional regulatory protein DegU [Streptomyces sp. YIM 130001]|uniref:LuxR C-terminal-related transcriptional regulator n=1 Tax=Streptomyces sp. YIM 130001 TaxID=2259644 RepID=UPI000EEF8A6D|nr:LuxR C-terminal-related transcriptional regulator [Streptomyces sp. YIM 130001]RII13025.1 Transcriptional regulatory protein DegU [Streptomyces sp. YIM 130001]